MIGEGSDDCQATAARALHVETGGRRQGVRVEIPTSVGDFHLEATPCRRFEHEAEAEVTAGQAPVEGGVRGEFRDDELGTLREIRWGTPAA